VWKEIELPFQSFYITRKNNTGSPGRSYMKQIDRQSTHKGQTIDLLQAERYELLDKLEPYPIKVRLGEQVDILGGLSQKELDMRVDLRPFMQRTPFIIQVPLGLTESHKAKPQTLEP
jgi:hypothetical protein